MNSLKTCPVCLKEFPGRRNQIYCSIACKSNYNNNKASQLRSEMIDNKIMQNNFQILREFYELYGKINKIEVIEFYKRGFIFECPTRKVKSPKYGYEFYIIHSFAYRVISQQSKQYIVINKKEEIINF